MIEDRLSEAKNNNLLSSLSRVCHHSRVQTEREIWRFAVVVSVGGLKVTKPKTTKLIIKTRFAATSWDFLQEKKQAQLKPITPRVCVCVSSGESFPELSHSWNKALYNIGNRCYMGLEQQYNNDPFRPPIYTCSLRNTDQAEWLKMELERAVKVGRINDPRTKPRNVTQGWFIGTGGGFHVMVFVLAEIKRRKKWRKKISLIFGNGFSKKLGRAPTFELQKDLYQSANCSEDKT